MANCCPEPGVVLVGDATDPLLYNIGILLIEILDDIKFYIAPPFGSETINGVNIANRFQRFAHQNQSFLFYLNDAPTGSSVRLKWMPANGARCRRRLIEQEGDCYVTLATQALGVETFGLVPVSAAVDDIIDHCIEIVFLTIQLVSDTDQVFRLHQLKLM